MERKYSIGFFIAIIVIFAVIGTAYQMNYNQLKEQVLIEKENKNETQMVRAEGQALKDECFFLMEVNGYVVVYLSDKKTIYEYTNILVTELPYLLQNEIKNGKYMENIEELYGFLENYSS